MRRARTLRAITPAHQVPYVLHNFKIVRAELCFDYHVARVGFLDGEECNGAILSRQVHVYVCSTAAAYRRRILGDDLLTRTEQAPLLFFSFFFSFLFT